MAKSKWVSFFLCLFLGYLGIHKFYEGRILLGIVYLCTGGLFGIGVIADLIILLFKPNPYYP
ncbi:MAG: TM2 domain-containing protein [Clostridia bacterium]|nr:TM2 domain-containing protein [Clostridia bacterium]